MSLFAALPSPLTALRRLALTAALSMGLVLAPAGNVQARTFVCTAYIFGICLSGYYVEDPVTPPAPSVPFTGVTHVVYLMGGTFLPSTFAATEGDKVMFVNLTGSSRTIRATDSSWTSGSLSRNQTYAMQILGSTVATFRRSDTSSTSGEWRLTKSLAPQVDPSVYGAYNTSLAEELNITKAITAIHETRVALGLPLIDSVTDGFVDAVGGTLTSTTNTLGGVVGGLLGN